MGSSAKNDYCAFTKAVEHLGDRWSLLIVRELFLFGPQGFNGLAEGLPNHISRSVLSAKLRKLEELGVIEREDPRAARVSPYRLAPAGEQLVPTLKALLEWAERWFPEDRALAERDPSVIAFWLMRRVRPSSLPDRQTVVEITVRDRREVISWLLLDADSEPELCAEDPGLDASRYVYVEADARALLPVARGERPFADAVDDRSVRVYGEPTLRSELPGWFIAPGAMSPGGSAAAANRLSGATAG